MSVEERPTRDVELMDGAVVVTLYTYITGRDARYIKEPFLAQSQLSAKFSKGENSREVSGVSGSVNQEMEDRAFERVVKCVKSGETVITESKKVIEFILDGMPESEYSKVVAAVNEVTDPKKA